MNADGMPQETGFGILGGASPDQTHHRWLRKVERDMAENYQEIFEKAGSSSKYTQEVGHEAEDHWLTFLTNWLPPSYEVATRKYIVGEVGDQKDVKETDLVVFRPGYPRALRQRPHVLASGVAAAFSVKSTIRQSSIAEAAEECARINRSLAVRDMTPKQELVRHFPYGVLAHSHDWKAPASNPLENVTQGLWVNDAKFAKRPKESIDLICVADLGVWAKLTSFSRPFHAELDGQVFHEEARLETQHVNSAGLNGVPPVATFLAQLYLLLAMWDEGMREISSGYFHMGSSIQGRGLARQWNPEEVLNGGTLQNLQTIAVGAANRDFSTMFGFPVPW